MLTEKQLPSRLILPAERTPVSIAPPQPPSIFRALGILLHFPLFIVRLLRLKLSKKSDKTAYVQRLCNSLEHFGALWIKAVQVLSTRADLLPPHLSEALSTIKDSGSGVPFEEVRQIIEEESGCSLEEIYEQFEELPFAATSLAQLHRAYLRHEKYWVAVKIHKPFVEQLVEQDRAIARWVVGALLLFSVYPRLAWGDLRDQAEELILRELDFRYEEYSLRRLKKKLRRHKIYVPDTFQRYSSRRVLVMEFIHAALMSDFISLEDNDPDRLQQWLTENNINPKKVANKLFFSVYRQIFEDNLFHADMHPGNVVLLKNSQVAIIDCRSMASLETELLDKYRMCMRAIADQRYATAADIYLLLAVRLPTADVSTVKADLIRVWRRWNTQAYIKELSYDEKSISFMFENLNRTVFEHDFEVQWPLSKMSRALANLDASLNSLNPKLNSHLYLRRYFRKAHWRTTKINLSEIPKYVPQSIGAIRDLPRKISEFTLFQQTILRRQAQSIQGSITTASFAASAFFSLASFFWLLLGGFCASALAYHCFSYPLESIVGKQLTAVVLALPKLDLVMWSGILVLVSYMYLHSRSLKRRFKEVEALVPDANAAI
jgi:ubiquinone biosynthesis protein